MSYHAGKRIQQFLHVCLLVQIDFVGKLNVKPPIPLFDIHVNIIFSDFQSESQVLGILVLFQGNVLEIEIKIELRILIPIILN